MSTLPVEGVIYLTKAIIGTGVDQANDIKRPSVGLYTPCSTIQGSRYAGAVEDTLISLREEYLPSPTYHMCGLTLIRLRVIKARLPYLLNQAFNSKRYYRPVITVGS